MKKLLNTLIFIGLFYPLYLSASSYNEYITDTYFGNGVWNTFIQADEGKREIRDRLIKKGLIKENEILYEEDEENSNTLACKKYAFKLAYNWHGMYRDDTQHDEMFKKFLDVAETFVQLREAGQLTDISLFKIFEWFVLDDQTPSGFDKQVRAYIELATTTRLSNTQEMKADYQQYSFDRGHRVLLVSHSQGNLWANDMVKLFKPWQKEYFRNVGVAVPADKLEAESRYVTLSCDLIMAGIPGHLEWNEECYGVEEFSGHEFDRSYLRNENSEKEIFRDIEFYLLTLGALPSQWKTDQEYEKDTCSHKITVKHRHDPNNIIMDEMVYPFAPNKKLYWVNGEWVKASCGGTEISSEWLFKKSNECHLLVDTNETITTPLLGNAELNTTVTLANIDQNKKVFLALVRTDFPNSELIDTIEVDTNQSTFWHLFEGLEYGRYNTNVYSSTNEVYDLSEIRLSEESPKGTLPHTVDMQYYTRIMTFSEIALTDEIFTITNLGTMNEFVVHFDTNGIITNDGSDSGFMDGNTWNINSDGDLEVISILCSKRTRLIS